MAKIIDPDVLDQGVEVEFLTGSLLIRLNTTGDLSTDGISLQTLYSFIKEEWKNDDNLIKFPFPILSITSEQFEFINGWDLSGSFSKYLIRDGGWALKDTNNNSIEEWMNITSLGSFVDSSDQAYFTQTGNTSTSNVPTNFQLSGEVNQGVQIYSSGSVNFDYRSYFAVYLREPKKLYASYNLIQEQALSELTYRKFALPLTNSLDLKFTIEDTAIDSNSDNVADQDPYSGMSITYYNTGQTRSIGGENYNFSIIIDANNGTAEQVYEFVQWSLRRPTDIDAGAGDRRGDIAEDLVLFIGDTLRTLNTSAGGVFIDNFQSADTNRLEFTDDTNNIRTFPFVAAGTITFNQTLRDDTDAIFKVFFENDDAGDNSGRDFGTDQAILINDYTNGNPITGSVSGQSSISFDYDYDNNVQRGNTSSGSVVPFIAVALGLETAQYTFTAGSITESTQNSINFVANLERNYLNPS